MSYEQLAQELRHLAKKLSDVVTELRSIAYQLQDTEWEWENDEEDESWEE